MRTLRFYISYVLPIVFACLAILAFTKCSDHDLVDLAGNTQTLKVAVTANDPVTKAIITDGFLPDKSSIGVALLNANEEALENVNYNYTNVKFTASGENEGQLWEPEEEVYLTKTIGTAYAYYPYSETVTDVSAIPVSTTGQTDYLYAKHTNLSTSATTATFGMKHALAVVSLTVVKGSYPGAGVMTQAAVRGPGICTGGKMNAKVDDDVSPLHSFTGVAEPIAVTSDITLLETGDDVNLIVVPNGQTSAFRITLTIDGKEYTTATSEIKLESGYQYHYTVTADERQLSVSSVTIGDWGYSEAGVPTIMVGGYSVKLAGKLSGLTFNSSVNDGTVTIQARPKTGVWVPSSITATAGATMTSNVEGEGLITIQLSEFTDDVTVTIDGYAVSLAGDLNKLAFNSKVSDGSVTIEARPLSDLFVPSEVSATEGAVFFKTIGDNGLVTVYLNDITANTTVTFMGYSIIFAGDYKDIAFLNKKEESSLIIKAINAEGYNIRDVTSDGSASMTQSPLSAIRNIRLTEIASDVTITFNGVVSPPLAIADNWAGLPDGKPALIDENYDGNILCIGVALINSASNQKIMIEKYEAANSCYTTAASGYSSTEHFYWGEYGKDQSITNYTSTTLAKADCNGKTNSEVLKTVTTGGSSYTSYATIGAVLNQFISTNSENQGYTDWYVPACGQLYLIYQNMTNINTALNAIGGTLLTGAGYWSSSEYSLNYGWGMYLNSGALNYYGKASHFRLRLIRYLF